MAKSGDPRRFLCLVVVAGLVWVLVACGATVPAPATPTAELSTAVVEDLSVVVADSQVPAIRAAASAYHREHREVRITVLPRASALAASALRGGDAEVALVTWLAGDLPETAWIRPVSRDGLAIVVNPQNGLPEVTMTQLQDLFQGRLEDWAAWGGLPGPPTLVSRENASGAFAFFQAWAMRDARVTLNALLVPNTEAMLDAVASDQLAVGYCSTAWLDARVRALPVNGVPPSREALESGLYPMTRTHFIVTLDAPAGAARGFAQWLLAEPGQAILLGHGFAPPPE